MNSIIWCIVIAGIVVGSVVALLILRKKEHAGLNNGDDILGKLVDEQHLCDILDINKLVEWFRENADKCVGEAVFFIAKPTVQTAKMFNITGNIEMLDKNHNFIAAVVDGEKKLPVALKLISYGSAPDFISNKLKDKDYIIINNN